MNLVNQKVYHKTFGKGTVLSFNGSYLLVDFPIGQKKFIYPDAFDGFLSTEDNGVASEIRYDIEKAKHAKEQAKQQVFDSRMTPIKDKSANRTAKRSKNSPRANIAFKCNFCDGGQSDEQVGFHGVCSDSVIRNNIVIEHRTWCTAEDCSCLHYYNGEISREELDELCTGGGFVCYESQMLRDWKALAGVVQNGENKSKPMTLRKVQQNSLCVLTTRDPGSDEKERYIFAVFLVDDSYEGDGQEEGYVSTQSKYKLKFSPDEARALLFWNYHANSNQPETAAWNSGLHRYFDDEQGAIILQDIYKAKVGTQDEALAKEFLEHFCRINGIDLDRVGTARGALSYASK
jgi:hypothetical protein